MARDLRLLLIEDSEDDCLLVLRELKRSGWAVVHERVDNIPALEAAMGTRWDAIVSDYSLPTFSAPDALAIVRARTPDTPFLIVSGTVDEETAVAAMRAGANDFMSKHKLARLTPALERELREAANRSDRAAMQEQLVLSDRMASVGTLAAGVAHEINNPLAAVIANLEFALAELDAFQPAVPANEQAVKRFAELRLTLDDAREAADRVRFIVRDLKLFSRATDERMGSVDVHEVIESSLRMARNEIRHRAQLIRDFGDVPMVHANEARLGQVFLNLLVNAAQAIAEGSADKNMIKVVTQWSGGDRVVVEVHDSGAGIPPEAAARIFEPFFTTKPVGSGTGLGLAIVHRIVSSFAGRVAAEPRPGGGTIFRVELPTARKYELATSAPPIQKSIDRRAQILVVDDEPMISSAVRRILGREHDVVALDAMGALNAIQGGRRFDVILCDVMMPDMSGVDLYEQLAKAAPEQTDRIVFMTGGAFTDRTRGFLDSVGNHRLEKPFDVSALHEVVRSLVKGKSS